MLLNLTSDYGEEKMNKKVTVLFIGGYGRSGSTLLDRVLGQIEGFFSGGEIRHMWERSFGENQLCGCNTPFKECNFWNEVIEEAFGDHNNIDLNEIKNLKNEVDRTKNIPLLMNRSLRSNTFQKKLEQYGELLYKFYYSIQKVSGDKIIIDSSKDPSHGFLLAAIPNIDLKTVHLVRDSRGVAYSWSKKKVRPEIHWKKEYMPRFNPIRSALVWDVKNSLMDILRNNSSYETIFRYEDLVLNLKPAIFTLLEDLGFNPENIDLDFINEQKVLFGIDHTVSGNPIRFKNGNIEVRADLEWESKMPLLNKRLLTTLTYFKLKDYGYFENNLNS